MGKYFKKSDQNKEKKWGRPAHINEEGKKELDHIRLAKIKYNLDKIPDKFEVHHIDHNSNNNEPYNLILIHKKDHNRIHLRKTLKIESVQPSKENDND